MKLLPWCVLLFTLGCAQPQVAADRQGITIDDLTVAPTEIERAEAWAALQYEWGYEQSKIFRECLSSTSLTNDQRAMA